MTSLYTDKKVLYKIDEQTINFIWDDINISIELTDEDIYAVNKLPEENLFIKLLKQIIDYIYVDGIIKIGKEIIPTLKNYCICCGNKLEYTSNKFITCGIDSCLYEVEELIIDNFVKNYFTENPIIFKFLLETAYYAINSTRRNNIFEPFPTNFLLDKNIQMERGKLSSLYKQDLSNYKDFNSLTEIIKENPISKLATLITTCETDREIADKIGDKAYKLIKFIINSNKTNMRLCGIINNFVFNSSYNCNNYSKQKYLDEINNFIQIEVKYNQEIEDNFNKEVQKYSSLFLFHGSSFENWYSIIRNGIKICSNTKLMTAGAAHGNGIYLSNNINLSLGYVGYDKCVFGVYEVLHISEKIHYANTIYVVNDENILLLRYLFVPPSINFIKQLDLNKVLNEKFNTKIQQEKNVVKKRSNNIRTKRLFSEYKKIIALNPANVGFRVELMEEDNLDIWKIFIINFDNNPKIKQDLDKIDIKEVEMELNFPERYPIEPPFIRIVSPRFVYQTGHITSGGSICMELLTKSGWSAMYSIESLIIDIKCQIVEGDGQIDMNRWRQKYTMEEAKQSFYRVANSHGWS